MLGVGVGLGVIGLGVGAGFGVGICLYKIRCKVGIAVGRLGIWDLWGSRRSRWLTEGRIRGRGRELGIGLWGEGFMSTE